VNINSTLIGQMLTFAIFVWVTMQYVWPALEAALMDRCNKISDGLSAAK
jgi:F-type H+-transporting ATPase subunit b